MSLLPIASRTRLSRNAGTTPSAADEDDQREQAGEPRPVRPEERADPPEVRAAHARVGRCARAPRRLSGRTCPSASERTVRRWSSRCACSPGCASAPAGRNASSTWPTEPAWPTSGRCSELGDEPGGLLYAVNQEYAERRPGLQPGDEVALIPPVSGGAFRLTDAADRPGCRGRGGGRRPGGRDRHVRRNDARRVARPHRPLPRLRGVRRHGREGDGASSPTS